LLASQLTRDGVAAALGTVVPITTTCASQLPSISDVLKAALLRKVRSYHPCRPLSWRRAREALRRRGVVIVKEHLRDDVGLVCAVTYCRAPRRRAESYIWKVEVQEEYAQAEARGGTKSRPARECSGKKFWHPVDLYCETLIVRPLTVVDPYRACDCWWSIRMR